MTDYDVRVPRTITELVGLVDAAWDRFINAVDALPPDQVDAPLLDGGWSAKDVLSHVRLYDRWLLGVLDPSRREEQEPYRSYLTPSEEAQQRDRVHRDRERALDVLAARRRADETHVELRQALAALADDRLSLPHRVTVDGMEPAADGRALSWLIALETYRRYTAHSRNLEHLAAR